MQENLYTMVLGYESDILTLSHTQPEKVDLDRKSFPKQMTIQNFAIDAQGFRKQKMKILPHGKWELPANQCRPICQPWAGRLALVSW